MSRLTPPQTEVLLANTIQSIENGFASKYHAVIAEDLFTAEEYLEEINLDDSLDSVDKWKDHVRNLGSALMAEAPIVFYLEPSNMARGILAKKVSPETGEAVDRTEVFIGLIGGFAGEGKPFDTFRDGNYLEFAVERLEAQRSTGLNF